MDFSVILVLPYSALVAIVFLVSALLLKRVRPRLIWPFAFSVSTAATVFVGLPPDSEFGLWIASLVGLSLWAAFGTVIGAAAVKLVKAAVRAFGGR